ncbi:sulfotransferase family protein [Nonlabens dokdonensis]|jgi:hypothetical protein|uniref:Sulfotransferase family protein n=2 Tax=Nonlabens dokdonensis TaxID=328515 RepID=L7WG11_NONDD|nr:sulfotransferase family 2 domain-containing protein [Nonlabens dokdonensis]AGC77833.1 hypothetical protein DDD_2706 [Nonlabens dokdonensis DSW-6]PZX39636.1 sulfotransferase family protein [Nonlabens dokdonensis]
MIISHQYKLIFIHVHRTGGSSISNLLRDQFGKNNEEIDQHSNVCDLGVDYFKKLSGYYVFGFTRNPWDRLLSWYLLLHQNNPLELSKEQLRFENFIEKDLILKDRTNYFHYNALDYFSSQDGENVPFHIFKYEEIESSLKKVFDQFNLELHEIPVLNTTAVKDKRLFYTAKSQQLIAQKCKKDIDYFNYTF